MPGLSREKLLDACINLMTHPSVAMKNILHACFATALITPLCAGDYTPAPAPAPAPSYESYGWFLGGGGDYLLDAEEMFWNGHIGYNLSEDSSIFLEAGWLGEDDEFTIEYLVGGEVPVQVSEDLDIDIDIVPVTLNYKYEWAMGDKLSWYIGAGLGAANIDVEVEGFGSDDEWTFMAQAFTGLVYEFTPAFEGYFGVRYMWLDEPDFGDDADLDNFDDFGVGAGLRFNF
jgi:opacity protein-like surface antigen